MQIWLRYGDSVRGGVTLYWIDGLVAWWVKSPLASLLESRLSILLRGSVCISRCQVRPQAAPTSLPPSGAGAGAWECPSPWTAPSCWWPLVTGTKRFGASGPFCSPLTGRRCGTCIPSQNVLLWSTVLLFLSRHLVVCARSASCRLTVLARKPPTPLFRSTSVSVIANPVARWLGFGLLSCRA